MTAAEEPTDHAEPTWSIGEVSDLTGLTTHTVRFYEQEGLFFAPVRRNSAGRRVFTADELAAQFEQFLEQQDRNDS